MRHILGLMPYFCLHPYRTYTYTVHRHILLGADRIVTMFEHARARAGGLKSARNSGPNKNTLVKESQRIGELFFVCLIGHLLNPRFALLATANAFGLRSHSAIKGPETATAAALEGERPPERETFEREVAP